MLLFGNLSNNLKLIWKKYGWEISLILLLLAFIILKIFINKSKNNKNEIDLGFIYKTPKNYSRKKYNLEKNLEYNISSHSSDYISKGERECKRCIERIFNKPFTKIRPEFLKNEVTGKNLELDLYNPDLKLCIEMNGRQHYEYTPYFHKNYEAFLNQKYRDVMKKAKCREYGVRFIEVPYTVKLDEIESYLIKELKKLNYF